MTLIIAGIQAGDPNFFTTEEGFCVSDGLGSIGALNEIFSAEREKINVLTPEQRIGTGWRGNGYQTIGHLKRVLVAQAGNADFTGQVIAKYLAKLRALYICYQKSNAGAAAEEIARLECQGSQGRTLCMRYIDDAATVRGLPTNEDLPPSERNPELSMGYAAYLLARTFETTFAEILSHEPAKAINRFNRNFSELLLMGVDWPEPKIRLFKFTPVPVADPDRLPSVSVSPQEFSHNTFAVIGGSPRVRSRLEKGLQTAASRNQLSRRSLAENTILKICAAGWLPGVGGQVREALCETYGVTLPVNVPELPSPRPMAAKHVRVDFNALFD